MFELYLSKLNAQCPYLWQKPRSGQLNFIDAVWYEGRQVGHNPLETFMRTLSESANLNYKNYTNHSIHSTCISKLDSEGFEVRHITALTSHKSESTIKEYSVKCPEKKCKEMFEALTLPMLNPKEIKTTSTVTKPVESAASPFQRKDNNMTYTLNIPTEPNDLQLMNIDLLEMELKWWQTTLRHTDTNWKLPKRQSSKLNSNQCPTKHTQLPHSSCASYVFPKLKHHHQLQFWQVKTNSKMCQTSPKLCLHKIVMF